MELDSSLHLSDSCFLYYVVFFYTALGISNTKICLQNHHHKNLATPFAILRHVPLTATHSPWLGTTLQCKFLNGFQWSALGAAQSMGPPESHSASVSQAIEPTPPRVGGAEVAVADTHALICTLCNSGLEVGVLPINPMGPGNNRKQFRFNMLGGGGAVY